MARLSKSSRIGLAAVVVELLAIIFLVLFVVLPRLGDAPLADPLGMYPVQTVDGVDGYTVTITGTKCNDSTEVVSVRTELYLLRLKPPGANGVDSQIVLFPPTLVNRDPGCVTQTFINELGENPEVRAAFESTPGATWQLRGAETPVVDGRDGVPRIIESENFKVEAPE